MQQEYVNENELKLLGYKGSELIGKNVVDFIHPDDIQRSIEAFLAGFMKGEGSGEFRIRHKDGQYTWFETKGRIFTDTDGQEKALLISRDISENKRMKEELVQLNQELEQRVEARTIDLKVAQEKLIRQEKLAAVGKIASTISHELRNPLAVISNSIYFLDMKLGAADEKIRKHVNLIQAEVDRSRKIITNLLDLTRMKQLETKQVELAGVIKSVVEDMTIPHDILVTIKDNVPGFKMKLDPVLLMQAFSNIVINAIQAMTQGGLLTIMIDADADIASVSFKDTGTGIPEDNMKKLFEPLFTTKKSGIGLGLTLVKDIVEKHGGRIVVDSKINTGSTFIIKLPIH